jgi:hypothetical protein
MAQPAAVLSILVTANAKQAQAALAKTQTQLTATTRTANATSASMKRLGTAAKVGGAVLAGGLYFGLKKSVEEAREANKVMAQTEAVLKSTAKASNVTAKEVENLAEKLSEKSGIDDEAIQSGENLLLTFKNIRNEAGKGNKIFDQTTSVALDMSAALGQDMKSSAIQLGKALNDPSVGLTALRRVGVSFTAQQTEQILKMQESGDLMGAQKKILAELTTEFKGSAKSQADAGDRLRVIFNNMAEDVGQKVVPVLSDMAEKVSDILGNKKLTGDQKADALAQYFTKMFGKGLDALQEFLPQLAAMGGKMAVRLAESFVKAFWEAPILGKLFLAGMLLKAIGGPTVLRSLGNRLGMTFAGGFSAAVAAGFILALTDPEFREKVKNIVAGEPLDTPGKEVVMADIASRDQTMDLGWETLGLTRKGLVEVATKYGTLFFDEAGKVAKAKGGILKHFTGETLAQVSQSFANGEIAPQKYVDALGAAMDKHNKRLKDGAKNTESSLKKFRDAFGLTREKVDGITRQQAQDVAGNVGNMVNAVGRGLKTLGNNTNKALQAFGVKKLSFAIESVGKAAKGFQRGGPINTGAPSGDSVPAMLEKGEYVLNRNAVSAVGRGSLDKLNFGAAKRFATGGVVEALGPYSIPPISYDANHAGGNSHVHVGMSTSAAVVALGRKLQSMGFLVSEHPAFGGVDPVHTTNSLHYSAQAIDVNSAASAMETRAEVASIARLLGGGGFGGAVVQKLKKLILSGPDGPLKSMGQGALDKAYAAANALIAKSQPASDVGNVGYASGGQGGVVAQMGKILLGSGFDRFSAAGIIGNAYRESLWNPASVGSGGGGLFGFTTPPVSLANLQSFASSQGKPWTDVGLQMQFMLNHGGLGMKGPLNALSSTAATTALFMNEWERPAAATAALDIRQSAANRSLSMFQKGGMVPSLDTGGRVMRSGLAEVHPGDVHMGQGSPTINVYVDPVSLDVRVESIVEGMAPDIAEFTARQLGRGQGRSRQLARG